jgi:hypothetical protein
VQVRAANGRERDTDDGFAGGRMRARHHLDSNVVHPMKDVCTHRVGHTVLFRRHDCSSAEDQALRSPPMSRSDPSLIVQNRPLSVPAVKRERCVNVYAPAGSRFDKTAMESQRFGPEDKEAREQDSAGEVMRLPWLGRRSAGYTVGGRVSKGYGQSDRCLTIHNESLMRQQVITVSPLVDSQAAGGFEVARGGRFQRIFGNLSWQRAKRARVSSQPRGKL